ncbi:hypothetical protein [Dyadobacter sp. LHD-138]|uniref:hypothetical protein n=1 Tax=Dyadobacter sp. LHD-138 TaxID=3071413 RepID=UPI0027DF652A|nr:hypothetical protein [Dyadobacter sp. LHD-138]MDQ6479195.1 hypothetical protein [Dyadobacter sp. LHD-138]
MKQFFIYLFLMIAAKGLMAQNNVGINTASPDASAVLDISSSNKGLLIPRLSQSERGGIQSPATGLLIFQTDNTPGFYYNAGTTATPAWTAVGAGSSTAGASIYGNGAGGVLTVPSGSTLDLAGTATIPAQYSSITINGTLIVSSGTKLRCSGNVTVAGTITVAPAPNTAKSVSGDKGIASSLAHFNDVTLGAKKFPASSVSSLINIPLYGGGSGGGGATGESNGGGGGGSFAIYALGNISVPSGGQVNANGAGGVNNVPTSNTSGAGGGGGGLIVLVSKGTITIGGTLRANGGSGTSGLQFTGSMRGGGGGGAGGIVCLVAPGAPSVTGSVLVNGGAGGATSAAGTGGSTGANGGASGGDGGIGGSPATSVLASGGSSGLYKTILTSNPENLY